MQPTTCGCFRPSRVATFDQRSHFEVCDGSIITEAGAIWIALLSIQLMVSIFVVLRDYPANLTKIWIEAEEGIGARH